jgi:hypothetical protein
MPHAILMTSSGDDPLRQAAFSRMERYANDEIADQVGSAHARSSAGST